MRGAFVDAGAKVGHRDDSSPDRLHCPYRSYNKEEGLMRFPYRVLALLLSSAFLMAAAHSAALDKNNSPWWAHIKTLASDDFQGRLTGSPGYRKAADYVAGVFAREGLKPAGTDGYFQDVKFEVQTIQTASSRVMLTSGKAAPIDVSEALVISPGILQRKETKAPLVFAGYGIHLPEEGYDDFAGLDVRGAIVVFMVGGPESIASAHRAHAIAEVLPHYLESAGAVGVMQIGTPKNREVPWARQKAAGTQPGMVLAEKGLRRYQGEMFGTSFDETKAEMLFAGSGKTFEGLVALADAHKPLPHLKLATTINAHVEAEVAPLTSVNVVGELPGSDPALAPEAVVLSAHLDHLGTGKPDHGNGIFHGAMDDASGIATLLQTAHMFNASKAKPRRSILFLAVCAEEKGLLGSRYFAAHPTSHAGHLIADINTDMFLPLYPLHDVVGFGADDSTLGDDVREVAAKSGVKLVPDPEPDHLVFVRSDQYNFVRKGTPAIMLQMSPAAGTPQEATRKEWFSQRYHAQADDLDQPVDLGAAEAYTKLVYQLAVHVADQQARPQWKQSSYFGRFATNPLP
jgi:Zn-dependent M28 family amino/carboxypeptidase